MDSRNRLESLPPGAAGTRRTLEVMAQAVRGELAPDHSGFRDEFNRRAALKIVAAVPGHDDRGTVSALFAFVRDAVRYRRDPIDTERVQDCRRTLELESGDCDDKCVCLATLLAAMGYLPRFVAQRQGGDDFDHVYVEVALEHDWVALDPTADGFVGETFGVGQRNPAPVEQAFEIFPAEASMALNGFFDNYLTGERNPGGSAPVYYPDSYGGYDPHWWEDELDRGLDILGARYGRGAYYSPDDPRFRRRPQQQQQQQQPYPYNGMPVGNDPRDAVSAGAVNRQGFQLNWWTGALIGALAVAFFAGKKGR